MNVTFMQFSKRVNSTKIPTSSELAAGVKFENVVLKESTNIDNPTLIIDGASQDLYAYNYVYIHEWGRYYFIETADLRHATIFTVKCTLDELGTFKSTIQAYTAFVERCADPNYYNTDIMDSALTVEDVVEHQDSATTNVFFGVSSYVVRMLGRGATGIQSFVSDGLSFWGNIFNPVFNTPGYVQLEDLITAFISDPSKYVLGVFYTPFNPARMIGSETAIFCGWYDTGKRAKALSSSAIYTDTITLNKPTSIYSDFRKTDPSFSQYTLFLPGIGTVPLSPDIMDSTLTLEVKCDQHTGDIIYMLKADGSLVSTYNGNCYASLQIGNGDSSNGGTIIKTSAELIGDVLSANVLGAATDVIEGIRQNISPTPSFIGSRAGVAGVNFKDAIISVLQKHSADFPTDVYGRPCCKNLLLSNLSGYVKCKNSSISLNANKAVIDSINSKLDAGIYIE